MACPPRVTNGGRGTAPLSPVWSQEQTFAGRTKMSARVKTGLTGPCTCVERSLLLKQPVADLLRYEALRPLPCLVIVAAELEVLPEHDTLGCCIDGNSLRELHQGAHLMKAADDQDPRAGL